MKLQVSALNEPGTELFRAWLREPSSPPPVDALTDSKFCQELDDSWWVDTSKRFSTSYQLGEYLHGEVFGLDVDRLRLRANNGMWAWISLAMLPNLLKRARGNDGLPLDERHYIDGGARLAYRLIARTAWELVYLHGSHARLAVSSLKSPWGDVAEQIASRQEIYMHPGFWAVADRLYVGEDGAVKPGVAAIRKREHRRNPKSQVGLGAVRRLATSFGQFERTYLLREMSADEIIGILPAEYGRWVPAMPTIEAGVRARHVQIVPDTSPQREVGSSPSQ